MDGETFREHLLEQSSETEQSTFQREEVLAQQQYDVVHINNETPYEPVTGSQFIETPSQKVMDSQLIETSEQKPLELTLVGVTRRSFSTPHNSYTVAFKISVLDWYHSNGENKSHTSKHFGVDRKRVRDWLLAEDNLRAMPLATRMRRKKFAREGTSYGKRPVGSEQLDQAVLNWYKEQRSVGKVVYSRLLRAKALEFGPQCGLPETFKASSMWLQRWKKRFAADIRQVEGDEQKDNSESVSNDFEEHLRQLEKVSVHLTDGQDDDLAVVAASSDVSMSQTDYTMNSSSTVDQRSNTAVVETGTSVPMNGALASHGLADDSTAGNTDALQEKLREQDQWADVIQQSLESLEMDFSKRIGQVKLVLQQLRSCHEQMKQQVSTVTQTQPVPARPYKRPSTPSTPSTLQAKRPCNI